MKVDISIISISALDLERMELRVEIYLEQVNLHNDISFLFEYFITIYFITKYFFHNSNTNFIFHNAEMLVRQKSRIPMNLAGGEKKVVFTMAAF